MKVSKRTVAWTTGAVLWLVLPMLVVVAAFRSDAGQTFAPTAAVWVSAEENTEPVSRDVQVALTWGNDSGLVAPGWAGLVQDVRVAGGSVVKDGDVVLVIDGVQRVAAATARPFYRPLSSGSEGPDVAMLNRWLAGHGYDHAPGDEFTSATGSGVKAFAGSIKAGSTSTFDPGWVVFLPAKKVTLTGVDVKVASPAPGAGNRIATVAPTLVSAVLVNPGTVPTEVNPDQPAAPVAIRDGDRVTGSEEQTLLVNGQLLPLSKDRTAVAVSALPDVAAGVQAGAPALTGALSSPAPAAVVVPANAVWTSADGATCIVVDEAAPHGVQVVVAGNRGNSTILSVGVSAGTRVQVAPPAGDRTCQ